LTTKIKEDEAAAEALRLADIAKKEAKELVERDRIAY